MKSIKLLFGLLFGLLLITLVGCKNSVVITHQTILDGPDNYHFKEQELDITDSHAKFHYTNFTGVKTLWELETNNPSKINISYQSYHTKGNLKIVLITPEEIIINIFEKADKDQYNLELSSGNYQLKVVGFESNGYLKVDLSTDTDIEIKNKEEL